MVGLEDALCGGKGGISDRTLPLEGKTMATYVTLYNFTEQGLKNIKDSVSWDIMGLCLEIEYSDIVNPIFFIPHLDPWYASGHFPCGWDGDEFAHDFESGDETIRFDGWRDLSRHGRLIVF